MVQIAYMPFEFPGLPQVGCAFTSRIGGVSEPPHHTANISFDVDDEPEAVSANRLAIQERLGFSSWNDCHQVHGDVINFDLEPGRADRPAKCEGDGLATAQPGQALVIKTADCQPLLLAHESGKYVAGLHVGWRGNRINFPATGVQGFCERYGFGPGEVLAVRGPSLGPGSSQFVNFMSEFGSKFSPYHDEKAQTVDLWRLTRDQLLEAGLQENRIFGMNLCTMDMAETFFSYRRDKKTGRQAGIIWIREE